MSTEPNPQTKTNTNRWKTPVFWIAGILMLLFAKAIGSSFGHFAGRQASVGYNEGSIDAALPNILLLVAKKLKSQLPVKVDQETTMIDVMAAGKSFMYIYSLSLDIKSEDLATVKTKMAEDLQKRVCGTDATRKLIALGATMIYSYNDNNGDNFQIPISKCL